MFSNSLIACPVSFDSLTVTGLICKTSAIIIDIIPVLVALATLYFFWGLANWVLNSGDAEKTKEGRTRMIWGLVALFFILSIGGVIALLMNTFFGGGGGLFRAPSSSISRPLNSGVPAPTSPVQAPVNQSTDPGFFRCVWCAVPFGDRNYCSQCQN